MNDYIKTFISEWNGPEADKHKAVITPSSDKLVKAIDALVNEIELLREQEKGYTDEINRMAHEKEVWRDRCLRAEGPNISITQRFLSFFDR